ncbi:SIMPL domain-containing protein [Salinimonas iocasae]|uniref:SIMPL domain-containing protein n=1 Tax=Salinimonas iocasae TaxID=2572577 RepID=A0A5B7YBC3_9ALTE|nr:SIMPL domain-containing protein [Salinimonas iocasae]QCZ92795.1 SIMPL domain-containing protein [Salinimonas iocasae]
MNKASSLILSAGIIIGLSLLALLLGRALVEVKAWDRVVTVKGLSEKEYIADTVIWPLQFTVAANDVSELYKTIETQSAQINAFLLAAGVQENEVSIGKPAITDKLANQYGGNANVQFRYTATQTVTVYSKRVEQVRKLMSSSSQLVEKGIVLSTQSYEAQTEYVFTRLNEVKPEMIEQATLNAREVAQKFAKDSDSQLGKIKRANQGQFSISARDKQHPHIKKIRVVSTIQYTLVD